MEHTNTEILNLSHHLKYVSVLLNQNSNKIEDIVEDILSKQKKMRGGSMFSNRQSNFSSRTLNNVKQKKTIEIIPKQKIINTLSDLSISTTNIKYKEIYKKIESLLFWINNYNTIIPEMYELYIDYLSKNKSLELGSNEKFFSSYIYEKIYKFETNTNKDRDKVYAIDELFNTIKYLYTLKKRDSYSFNFIKDKIKKSIN
jgi:hypothetical protein